MSTGTTLATALASPLPCLTVPPMPLLRRLRFSRCRDKQAAFEQAFPIVEPKK